MCFFYFSASLGSFHYLWGGGLANGRGGGSEVLLPYIGGDKKGFTMGKRRVKKV